jgi:hypothetical protein
MNPSSAAAAATIASAAAELNKSAARRQAQDSPKANSQDPRGAGPPRPSPNTIRDALIPSLLQLASGAGKEIDGPTFKAYRNALVKEAGSQDILEQFMLESVAVAHLASFHLLASAGVADTAEAAAIYAGVAAKLLGEVRRTIVAIKALRSPPSPPNITVAATQHVNVTASGAESATEPAKKTGRQSEVRSNDAPGLNRMREILGQDVSRAQEPAVEGAFD